MRAKIASVFGGHPFKDEYVNMDDTQLLILYRYVLEKEVKEKKASRALIKEILDATFRQFKLYFDEVQLFINAKLFKQKMDYEEQMKNDVENPYDVTVDNFEEVWKELEQILPMEVEVDYNEHEEVLTTLEDPEFDELLAGWIEKKQR